MTTIEIDILAQKLVTELANNDRALSRLSDFLAKAILVSDKNKLPDFISKNVAYKNFGRKSVDEWILLNLIEQKGLRNRIMLNTYRLRELEQICKTPDIYEKEKLKYIKQLIA